MVRTTPDLVKEIIEVDASISLTPFILVASQLVDLIPELSLERLTVIETWLAAHFYTIRDPRATQQTAGSVSESYQSRVSYYLANSHYGQQAVLLDTTRTLATLNRPIPKRTKTASVNWLGNPEEA